MSTSPDSNTDGRIKRSERSRTAIVQAMLELIGEGSLSPTAQQVAERADVGVRTVFRHFSDMDTLFAAMNERLTAETGPYFLESVQAGSFEERVDALIERRTAVFSKLAPYVRSSTVQRWRSAFLQSEHERSIRLMRKDLLARLPELETAPTEISDAVEMAVSFEVWNRLRLDQRLSLRRTALAIRRTVLDLTRTIRSTPSDQT